MDDVTKPGLKYSRHENFLACIAMGISDIATNMPCRRLIFAARIRMIVVFNASCRPTSYQMLDVAYPIWMRDRCCAYKQLTTGCINDARNRGGAFVNPGVALTSCFR
jgi:hypothetical protein